MPEQLVIENISPVWREWATADTTTIYVLSPYLTGLATTVLEAVPKRAATVYTLFHAEVFLSGGSSLEALRWVLQREHSLFMLRDLHAKIVFIPGCAATIGSQNMTTGGLHNKEATVVLRDKASLEEVADRIKGWATERSPITLAMIDEMDAKLAPLREKMVEIANEAKKVDKEAEANAAQAREEEKERQVQEALEEARDLRAKAFAPEFRAKAKSSRVVVGMLTRSNQGLAVMFQ